MKEAVTHHPEREEKAQEACGLVGVVSFDGSPVSQITIRLAEKLQHRGYDTAGIVVYREDTGLAVHTGLGRISEVFPDNFDFEGRGLLSDRALAHNRYGTSELNGDKDHISGAMPITSEYGKWSASLVYNGNLPDEVRMKLRSKIPAELLKEYSFDSQDIIDALVSSPGESWPDKFRKTFMDIDGALSIGIMTGEGEMYGYRGASGTWPLWLGKTENNYVLSSETRVQNVLGYEIEWREVLPGELVQISPEGARSRQIFVPSPEVLAECSLHAMYNARPDSIMAIRADGEKVTYGDFRKAIGRKLAQENPIDADTYFGVPYTGLPIAEGYAEEMGVDVSNEAITIAGAPVSSEDVVRSYIQRTNDEAADVVDGKYIAHRRFFEGKIVVSFDDSMIKGLTVGGKPGNGKRGTVSLMREAGAKEVHLMFGMPKFVEGCDMGVVIKKGTLIAIVRQEDGTYLELSPGQIAQKVGADSVYFLSPSDLKAVYENITQKEGLCTYCVGGGHPLEKNREAMIREPVLAGAIQ